MCLSGRQALRYLCWLGEGSRGGHSNQKPVIHVTAMSRTAPGGARPEGDENEPLACRAQAPSFTELLLSLFVGCMTGGRSIIS
jgi:hypothetical protein